MFNQWCTPPFRLYLFLIKCDVPAIAVFFANSVLSARLLLFSDTFSPLVAIHMTPMVTGITKLSFPTLLEFLH